MNRIVRNCSVAGMAILLTACQAVNYGPPPGLRPVPQQPQGTPIEGEWVDPNGIISRFNNGRFETRTTDSNDLLADGSYRFVSPRLVEIDLTSRLRGTRSTVNCAVISPSQLNCTADSGAQFSLSRRAAG